MDLDLRNNWETKLILVNHFSGIPSRIDKIEKIIKNKKIYIVEDAATSFGSKIGNKNIGSFKKSISVFSLQANKIITTGEGGFISLRNRKLAQKIREYINCGFSQTVLAMLDESWPTLDGLDPS